LRLACCSRLMPVTGLPDRRPKPITRSYNNVRARLAGWCGHARYGAFQVELGAG
jgi:hypothetical protein